MTAQTYPSSALETDRTPLTGLSVALTAITALALLGLLFAGREFGWSAEQGGTADSDGLAVSQLLTQEQQLVNAADGLLSQRDANPTLIESPAWLASHEQVTVQLETAAAHAQAVDAPGGRAGLQACLVESTRLIATSQRYFQTAFTMGGHGAYYYSAHANWDYNLGKQELARCQALSR